MKNSASKKTLTIQNFALIILLGALFAVSGCKNTTTDVMSSYDSKFPVKLEPGDDRFTPGIGEVGFDETKMLDDEYFKSSVGTLQLRGPKNAALYEWTLYLQKTVIDPDNGLTTYPKEPVTLPASCFQTNSSTTTEYFIVYIPLSGLKPGSYVIQLRAKSKGGLWYSDRAALVIYDIIREES